MRKGLWSPDEDERLLRCITKYVNGSWSDIAQKAGLDRCGKSCRRRWMNHLRPDLKRCKFSMDEINLIVQLQEALGNRWSEIASHLEGRTDNDVKNLWNTQIKRRLLQLKNQNGAVLSASSTLISFGNVNLVDGCSRPSCEGPDQLINYHNSASSSNYLISDIKSQISFAELPWGMQNELCTLANATQTSGKVAVDCFAPALLRSCNTSVFPFETAPPPPPLPPITAPSMPPYTRVIDFQGTCEDNSVESSCIPEAELQCHTQKDSISINENVEECSSDVQLTINPLLITQLATKASPNHLLSSFVTRQTNADCTETLQQQYCCHNNISTDIDHINNAAGSIAAPPPIDNTKMSTILWGGVDQLESMAIGLDLAECNIPQLSLPDWCKFLQSNVL